MNKPRTIAKSTVNYQLGTISQAGWPILYDRYYSLDEARAEAASERWTMPVRIYRVTVEEVVD